MLRLRKVMVGRIGNVVSETDGVDLSKCGLVNTNDKGDGLYDKGRTNRRRTMSLEVRVSEEESLRKRPLSLMYRSR